MDARKNMKYVAWRFSLRFPNYFILSHYALSFLCEMLYLLKWCEIFMVVYLEHVVPTVIFVDLMVEFSYMFTISPD